MINKIILFSCLVFASNGASAVLNSESQFEAIQKENPNLNLKVIDKAKNGDVAASMQIADYLLNSNVKQKVIQGEAIYIELAKLEPIARLKLGVKYLEGIPFVGDKEKKPEMFLRNYHNSILMLEAYLQEPINDNYDLLALAVAFLSEGYMKTGNDSSALELLKNNLELAKYDPSGNMAYLYAKLLHEGNVVEQDLEISYLWYSLASDRGVGMAIVEKNWLKVEYGFK